ncbi:MAG: cupin domain-containing protein [Saprospiraceae bacterium]|nr:cupin domain-containing protein [Saprospiraceae bacterium]
MNPHLIQPNESKEFFTSERCHILELLNNHDTTAPFSIARARVEPGVTTAWHRLNGIKEYYYILEGRGFIELGENEGFEVQKNDLIKIDENMAQRIKNTGDEDLLFLCLCNPPFTDENYEEFD